jgi:hypothetical protein
MDEECQTNIVAFFGGNLVLFGRLYAVRSDIALDHMLFERDLVSDNFDDAVVIGDLLGVGHAGILAPRRNAGSGKIGVGGM